MLEFNQFTYIEILFGLPTFNFVPLVTTTLNLYNSQMKCPQFTSRPKQESFVTKVGIGLSQKYLKEMA